MDQSVSSSRRHLLESDSGDDNVQRTLCSRVKTLLSQNCIFIHKFAQIGSSSGVETSETATQERHSKAQNSQKFLLNPVKFVTSTDAKKRKITEGEDSKETFLTEESSFSTAISDVINSQPTREAPYYYGDIIRTRNLDASTIFPQTSTALKTSSNLLKSPLKTSQIISILKSDKSSKHSALSSVEVVTSDKHTSRLLRLGDKSYIMDGLRVQLKNASTRIKGAAIPTSTPQRFRQKVNRSQESHVSLRGWLYRLEGGALKQWKRRWCVLADYCLFYYKDMAETKLLGSAILPSFKINPCLSGDGISRKYSFKIEHSNMKTYYFAADTKEIQQQWMSALSMATIMQLSIFQNQKRTIPNSGQFDSPLKTGEESTGNNTSDIDKSRLATGRMMGNGHGEAHYQQYFAGGLNGNCVSNGNAAKLLYAPDGYPLSNMIDDSRNELDNPGMITNNNIHSPANINNNNNNNNHTSSKHIDDVNGLPTLYHQTPTTTNLFPYQHSKAPYQSMPGYQYPIDSQESDIRFAQNGFFAASSGVVPPPKPRRAQAQDFFCEPQQYFSPQTGLIYDSFTGYDYSGQMYHMPGNQAYQTQIIEPLFYSDMNGQQTYMPAYMANSYMDYRMGHMGVHHDMDRPKRPHSADFLERAEEDLDCEVAFHDPLSSINGTANTNVNGNCENVKPKLTMPQKIMPTRPKSSFARYNDTDVGAELYDFPINLPISGRFNGYGFAEQSIPKQNFTSDDENRLNELSEVQQNRIVQQSIPKIPLPTKSQAPLENVGMKTILPFTNPPQLPTYIPEAEVSFPVLYQHSPVPKPLQNGHFLKPVQHSSQNSVPLPLPLSQNDFLHNAQQNVPLPTNAQEETMMDPHRDELYKASQMFYRRTSSIISDSGVGASTQSSLYNAQSQSTNEDWSESGLPTPATASQDSLTESASRSGEERDILSSNVSLKNSDNTKNLLKCKNEKIFEPKYFNGFDANKTKPLNVNEKINNKVIQNIQNNNGNKANNNANNVRNQLTIEPSSLNERRILEKNLLISRDSRLFDQGVFDLNINDSEEPEVGEDTLLAPLETSIDSSIRFKLGQKVRTYRKPRPSSSSSTASSSLPSDILAQTLSKNDPQAPYYITDLLNEQQRKDLQKKLPSNPLPALLSRSTLDSARQAGTTTLCLKTATHKNQESADFTDQAPFPNSHISQPSPYPDSLPLPLPSRLPFKIGNKSLDDYFGTFDSSESESTTGNAQVSAPEFGSRRKRRTKRRSKVSPANSKTEKGDNASDSELHLRFRQRNRKSSNQRLYGSTGDFIGKSREELTLMLDKYRRQQCKLSTSCNALKIAMESDAKMAELDPCKASEYHSRMADFRRQLEETQQCVARKQPIIDQIDSLIRVSVTPDSALNNDKNEDKKDDNIENLKKQQNILAIELDRVRGLLTHSTRALEAKAVENAKMEAEMQAARKKLKKVLESDKAEAEISRSAKLELELVHINQVIDNLHSRRQELNSAIENLKYSSNGNEEIPHHESATILQIDEQLQAIVQNSAKIEESSETTSSESSESSESSDLVADDGGHSKMLEQKYRAFLAANTPLIPLYENLGSNTTVIPSFLPTQHLFPTKNENGPKDDEEQEVEDDENDEFFTMNLPKDVQLISSMQSQLQGCEFSPQTYHQINGNGSMDEQLQKLFAFQQQQMQLQGQQQQSQFLSPKTEIRTVREVKREAERRKHHQAQSAKINALIRSLPGNGNDNANYSQMSSQHFYVQEQQFRGIGENNEFANGNDSVEESPITAPDLIQSTIH